MTVNRTGEPCRMHGSFVFIEDKSYSFLIIRSAKPLFPGSNPGGTSRNPLWINASDGGQGRCFLFVFSNKTFMQNFSVKNILLNEGGIIMGDMISRSEVLCMLNNWIGYYEQIKEICKELGNDGTIRKDAESKIELLTHMVVEIEEL